MKKNKRMIACMGVIAILIGVVVFFSLSLREVITKGNGQVDAIRQKEEITLKEATALIENGYSGILYFGYESCPYCKEAKPIVWSLKEEENTEFHYVKIKDKEDERLFEEKDKEEIYPYLKEYMEHSEDDYILYVPLIVAVRDGQVVLGHVSTVEDHDASKGKMSEEQKEELKDIYINIFNAAKK